ncbi:hypothetical protein AAVH_18560 [Aphelenchoides avenae]|nr:hypothetical protein AAVH_18560 [Aphelenchus avenae]
MNLLSLLLLLILIETVSCAPRSREDDDANIIAVKRNLYGMYRYIPKVSNWRKSKKDFYSPFAAEPSEFLVAYA